MTAQPVLPTAFEERLHRLQRQRDLALRGYERNRMSPQLAEALRAEIRNALEADGKPFDINVARRVYDLAIAAKDMCAAAISDVKQAIDQIKDVDGPMESLDSPGTPESQLQQSETFGARIIRELLAAMPMLNGRRGNGEDPKALVRAIAEAREKGLTDIAEALEVKLLGHAVTGVVVPVPEGSFEHGFADGKADRPPAMQTGHYHIGYLRGIEARFLTPVLPLAKPGAAPPNGLTGNRLVDDPPLCEACKKDPDPRGGSACFDCREIARARRQRADDGNISRYDDTELRGRPSNRTPMDPIEREELEGK